MFYYTIRCPNCGKPVDYRLWHIHTGLGAPVARCSGCGTKVSTGRREWADFSGFGKFRYRFLSLIYVIICGLMGAGIGVLVQMNLQVWRGEPPVPENIVSTPLAAGAVIMTLFTLWLQLHRVTASKKRPSAVSDPVVDTGYLNPHINLQFKIPVTLFTAAVLLVLPLAWKFVSLKFIQPG